MVIVPDSAAALGLAALDASPPDAGGATLAALEDGDALLEQALANSIAPTTSEAKRSFFMAIALSPPGCGAFAAPVEAVHRLSAGGDGDFGLPGDGSSSVSVCRGEVEVHGAARSGSASVANGHLLPDPRRLCGRAADDESCIKAAMLR
jgi:hypothetical protein